MRLQSHARRLQIELDRERERFTPAPDSTSSSSDREKVPENIVNKTSGFPRKRVAETPNLTLFLRVMFLSSEISENCFHVCP